MNRVSLKSWLRVPNPARQSGLPCIAIGAMRQSQAIGSGVQDRGLYGRVPSQKASWSQPSILTRSITIHVDFLFCGSSESRRKFDLHCLHEDSTHHRAVRPTSVEAATDRKSAAANSHQAGFNVAAPKATVPHRTQGFQSRLDVRSLRSNHAFEVPSRPHSPRPRPSLLRGTRWN